MKPHEMTKAEFAEFARNAIDSTPEARWDDLTVGDRISDRKHAWEIVSIPPKRAFVTGRYLTGDGCTTRIRKPTGYIGGKIYSVTDDLAVLFDVRTHEQVVRDAKDRGETVPLRVQADYPLIFTPAPCGWGESMREGATDYFRYFTQYDFAKVPGWQLRDLAYSIAENEADIARLRAERSVLETATPDELKIKAEEVRPKMLDHNHKKIGECLDRIEFAKYLIVHFERTSASGRNAQAA